MGGLFGIPAAAIEMSSLHRGWRDGGTPSSPLVPTAARACSKE